MKVHGYELPPEVEAKALEWMRRPKAFRAWEITWQMGKHGAPQDIAHRLADRLIQRERKAGNISQTHGRGLWSWVKKEEVA